MSNYGYEKFEDEYPAKNPADKVRQRMAADAYNRAYTEPDEAPDSEAESPGKKNGKENGCSRSEQQITALVILCIIIIIILSVCLVVLHLQLKREQKVGKDADYVIMAGEMLAKMDRSVAPCDNFYDYACSAYLKSPMIPVDQKKWGSFSEVDKKNVAVLNRLFTDSGDSVNGKHSTAVKKLKAMYNSCMDTQSIEHTGKASLAKLIQEFGNWTATGGTQASAEADFNFEKHLANAQLYGPAPFFSIAVTADDKNSSLERIAIDQSGLTLPDYRSYNGNGSESYKIAFVNYVSGIAKVFGSEDSESTANRIWDLEAKIAAAHMTPDERTDPEKLYHLISLNKIQDDLLQNSLDLKKLMKHLFNREIPATEQVLVYAVPYLKKLVNILNEADTQTKADYVTWHVISSYASSSGVLFRMVALELQRALYGISSGAPLYERCVRSAQNSVGFAAGALYIQDHFSQNDIDEITGILTNIRTALDDLIPDLEWMDQKTKDAALDKAKAVTQKIGYPEYVTNTQKLDKYYEKMEIGKDFFQNRVNVNKWGVNRNLDKLGKPADKNEWDMTPTEVNAYYNPSTNEIVFPAGILQNPFYDPKFLKSMSYGAVGAVMGHELTHAFDNQGRKFDKYGNLHSWWTNASAESFKKRTECLVKQYSSYPVGHQHLNGRTTLGENIADNGGLKVAYLAYKRWMKSSSSGSEPTLPGLDLTSDQLFFLSFAQVWCSYYTPQYAAQSISTDVHSFPKYRVIGTLSNMPQFAEAYQCEAGTKMNPTEKCGVW